MKKIISVLFLFLGFFYSFSYNVELPNANDNVKVNETSISKSNYYKNLSKQVNKYLWYAMWVISFAMVIYAGILLVTSSGNSEDLKKANKILIWWLVWIFVSLFAYTIINLLINLF